MSDHVNQTFHRDLARPTLDLWLAEQRASAASPRHLDVNRALDEARADYDLDERSRDEEPTQ